MPPPLIHTLLRIPLGVLGILWLLCLTAVSAQPSNITAIHPTAHPNLYFNQAEINQLRQAVLVDRSPQYAVDAWNLIQDTPPRGKPAQMDALAWPENYQAALPATQANFEATLSYLIEPSTAKAQQLKAALLSWTATQQGSWIPDVQHGGHIHFALAFMYDALYNDDVLTTSEKNTLDSWFQQTAQKTLLPNSWWYQLVLDGKENPLDKEGSYRDAYPNWYQFRVMGSVVTALVSHDQASVDAAANSALPADFFRLDTITQYAPATRDFKNMLTGLIYPSGYTWDGYARNYGFNAPTESYAGQQAGEGQQYHFFALMPVTLAAEAVAHNGFDAWNYQQQALRRSFVTGQPWAHNAYRSSDPPGTIRNWLPFYWLVYRHFPDDPTIRAAVQDARSRNGFSYTVHNSAPLWGVLGELGKNPGPTPTFTPTPTPPPATPLAPAPCAGPAGLQALYTFQEGSGTTIHDVSGVGEPLPLVIQDAAHVAWLPGGGLAVQAPTLIASTAPATQLVQASQATQAFTLAAWVRPAQTNQAGPARIVTLSQDPYQRNFTLGQDLSSREQLPFYEVRARTTETDLNGQPSVATAANVVSTTLTHLVYTLEAGAERKIYVDGVQVAADLVSGDLTNWNQNYFLALSNELNGDRPWLGEYHRVALYHCTFSASEVAHQFAAGPQAPLQQNPVASFTAEPAAGTAPLTVHFDATASYAVDGVVQTYRWDFGDGVTGTGATAQHVYTVSGTYTVTLTVTDQRNGVARMTQLIQVAPSNEMPQARFTASPVLGNVPLTVHFDASATIDDGMIITYAWDFGEGTTTTGMTVSHTYTTPGSYPAMLTVTDDGGLSSSAAVTIAVGIEPTAPIVTAQPVDALVALGDRVTFAVTATGAEPLAYQWYRNGVAIPGATAPIYTIPTVTAADQGALFTCVVTNVAGSSTSQAAHLTIRANREPTAQFTTSATQGGALLLVLFDATTSNDEDGTILVYTWDFGDGTTATGVTVSHTYSTPGIYVVTLTITDDQGATASTSTTIPVDIPPVSPIIIEQPGDVVVTEGEPATFVVTAAGTLPLFYQWQRDGIDIVGATTSSYTIAVVTSGDQGAVFSCVVTNGTGSTTTRGAALTIIPPQSGSVHSLYLPLVTR